MTGKKGGIFAAIILYPVLSFTALAEEKNTTEFYGSFEDMMSMIEECKQFLNDPELKRDAANCAAGERIARIMKTHERPLTGRRIEQFLKAHAAVMAKTSLTRTETGTINDVSGSLVLLKRDGNPRGAQIKYFELDDGTVYLSFWLRDTGSDDWMKRCNSRAALKVPKPDKNLRALLKNGDKIALRGIRYETEIDELQGLTNTSCTAESYTVLK